MNNPLVQPDPGLYIWTIVTFLVLRGGCWRSSPGGRCSRRSSAGRTRSASRSTTRSRPSRSWSSCNVESQRILAAGARRGRRDPRRVHASDANRFREELKQKARAEAAGIVKNAERQIELETARALQQIRHGSRRPVGRDRLQAAAAQRVEGRQRAASSKTRSSRSKNVVPANQRPGIQLQLPNSSVFRSGTVDWVDRQVFRLVALLTAAAAEQG